MTLRTAWIEYRDAVRAFSPPARLFLLATLLTWASHGVAQVLFNLFLVEAGYREAFVGRAISLTGLGLALTALPAGMLAERWGHRRTLILGAVIEGIGMLARALAPTPGIIAAASFASGSGQAMLAIAAAPFLSEHSTTRERTHLFSTFFAIELVAGVFGSFAGGALPKLLQSLPQPLAPDLLHAYRWTLCFGAGLAVCAAFPIARIGAARGAGHSSEVYRPARGDTRLLAQIAINFFLIGAGAGLVIPFMNLYFAQRFQCSSAQIGSFFSLAQLLTAVAAMSAPVLAGRFGRLRTATVLQLMSLPFLVTMGAESRLDIAVAAFCMRATLMQASSPLLVSFVMETLPAGLRARSTSINNLVWNIGWAVSATLAGWIIERFGYAVPFYITAALYAVATVYFYLAFRRRGESTTPLVTGSPSQDPGTRVDGPFTE